MQLCAEASHRVSCSTSVKPSIRERSHCELFFLLTFNSGVVSPTYRFWQRRRNTFKDCEMPRILFQLFRSGEESSDCRCYV